MRKTTVFLIEPGTEWIRYSVCSFPKKLQKESPRRFRKPGVVESERLSHFGRSLDAGSDSHSLGWSPGFWSSKTNLSSSLSQVSELPSSCLFACRRSDRLAEAGLRSLRRSRSYKEWRNVLWCDPQVALVVRLAYRNWSASLGRPISRELLARLLGSISEYYNT